MKTLIHSCEMINECKEIIVVDNASTDNSLEIFEEYSRNIMRSLIKIIKLNRNTGFCYAVNVRVALAKTEISVFIEIMRRIGYLYAILTNIYRRRLLNL
jgi:glycosyltransferase involved in cell wall biosynthesis